MHRNIKWVSLISFVLLLCGCGRAAPFPGVMAKETQQLSYTHSPSLETATAIPSQTTELTATKTSAPPPVSTLTPEPLTTPIPNNAGLTIEENEIKGSVQLDPLTFQPVHGTQNEILARHAEAKQGVYQYKDNSLSGEKQYRALEAIESDGVEVMGGVVQNVTVQLLQDGEVIFTASAGQASPINSIRGLWVDGSHWYLEIAYITNTTNGNSIHSEATGMVYQDGVLLNEKYGYEEMFGFQLLDGKPFYFYQQDGKIRVSYDNEDLPIVYDEIPHYRCCSGSAVNPVAAPNWVGFFGRKGEVWYYTEIGKY